MAEFPALPQGSPRGTGFIYFMLAEHNLVRPMLKIGFSLRSPDERLKSCQTGSPVKLLHLVGFVVGQMRDERELHRNFAAQHSHGEWFFFEDELEAYVEGLGL